MKLDRFLFVSKTGNCRVNTTGAGIKPNEIRIRLALDIPDSLFAKPEPRVRVVVPARDPETPETEVTLDPAQVAAAFAVTADEVTAPAFAERFADILTTAIRNEYDLSR